MLIGDLGEEALLKELRRLFAAVGPGLLTGIGDDAAVVALPHSAEGVWTTDLLLEGIHFQRDWQTPWQLGRKSLAVNLSDIASMGATPRFALLSISCPGDTPLDYILEFCQGFASLAAEEQVLVVGGDTTGSTGSLSIGVTVGGYIDPGAAVLRSGATAGDSILVTGSLGASAAGLRLLNNGQAEKYADLAGAFREPCARVAAGRAAAEAGATSMTDISDGLATDLRHICEESGVGAMIESWSLPALPSLAAAASEFGWDPRQLMLTGGEDYELLFTLPGGIAEQLKSMIERAASVAVTIVGEIMPAEYGIMLVDKTGAGTPMPARGYEHFEKNG
ncbi:MAG: thiamine-phosphate kinase [Thermoleophilia bacterium]